MPVTLFDVRWPDGGLETCYSPSTVIKSYVEPGRSYTVGEFLDVARAGLRAASDRVRAKFGGAGCSQAMAQLAAIEARARRHVDEDARIRVESFH